MRLNFRIILWPLSLFYRIVIYYRNLLFDTGEIRSVSFGVPVISVGNITAGGTGKTPHVEYLAAKLSGDKKVAVLSRGYGRNSNGFILLTKGSTAAEAGDEPAQIKRKFPDVKVAVDNDRVHGIKKLLKFRNAPEIIILDDAYQHRYVKPRVSILLVSFRRPIFNDLILPAGNLREPRKNTQRADIIIVTKCPPSMTIHERTSFVLKLKLRKGLKVYFTTYSYGEPVFLFPRKDGGTKPLTFGRMRKQDAGILLVTGIADPVPLKDFLKSRAEICESITYGDHHLFTKRDLEFISGKFRNIRKYNKYVVMTEKDAVRIRDMDIKDRKMRKALCYVPVEVEFLAGGERPFLKDLENFLK